MCYIENMSSLKPKIFRLLILSIFLLFITFLDLRHTRNTGLFDLDATHIEREPRFNYDAAQKWPANGGIVTFIAHVKNNSDFPAPKFEYYWKIDNEIMKRGNSEAPVGGKEVTISYSWKWAHQINDGAITGSHSVEFIVDPAGKLKEKTKANNSIKDYTQGLAIGFWVERSVYDYFNKNQFVYCQDKDCLGSNSWEDWAQRQVRKWNDLFQNSTPEIIDRVRLDKVIVVNDCSLPLAGGLGSNHPDIRDKSVDMMWGFTSGGVTDQTTCGCIREGGNCGFYKIHPEFLNVELPLLHELSHARYLYDLYNLNVTPEQVKLREGKSPIVETGLIGWSSPYHVYKTDKKGLMTGDHDLGYDIHSAFALNRIKGLRARGGNYNASQFLGEYLNDLPKSIKLRFSSKNLRPMSGISVKIFLPKSSNIFEGVADIEGRTDTQGIFTPSQPLFIKNYWENLPNLLFMYRLQVDRQIVYGFQDITDYNIAYWNGNEDEVIVTIKTNIALIGE